MRSQLTRVVDYAITAAIAVWIVGGAWAFLAVGVEPLLVSTLVVAPLVVAAAVLERVRPERREFVPLDQPLRNEAANFFFNYHLGYGLAIAGLAGIAWLTDGRMIASLWPVEWPMAVQVVLAVCLAEGASYWQHRLSHRIPLLWRFHALHHSGGRLNLVRAGRFHFMDIGPGSFLVFAPITLLGAPDTIVAWLATLAGSLGVVQHANIRMRTPRWVDGLVCTAAVHRHHHSIELRESDANFGTSVMLFDRLFGSYARPEPAGPAAMGIADDPVPASFRAQVTAPFRRPGRAPSALPGRPD